MYLGLKVTASFERSESYTRIIDGQVRCITPDFKPKDLQVAWNVQFITVFVPSWMVPPMYHSLRRESIKNTNSDNMIGVKSIRPTWFEDIVTSREPQPPTGQTEHEPMHGLKLVIKEEILPGDGLLEQSHMPVGWSLHIDGAVRQNCAHRGTTLQELDNLLGEYDLKRDLVEINRKHHLNGPIMQCGIRNTWNPS